MTSFMDILESVFISPLLNLFSQLTAFLPQIAITAFLLVVTYIIAHVIGWGVRKLLYKIKIDKLVRVEDLSDTFGTTSLASIFGSVTKWSIFILFIGNIFAVVDLGFISPIIQTVVFWLTKLVFAAITVIVGIVIIDFFTFKVMETRNKFMNLLSKTIRAVLILVIFFTVLEQFDLRLSIAENVFLMVIGAILFSISLAVGIGFGLGLKQEARNILKQIIKKIK